MDASTARAAEKKDKMDGSGFSDLPKKPSETRGKFLPSGSEFRVGFFFLILPVTPEGKGGRPTRTHEIYISKTERHLGSGSPQA